MSFTVRTMAREQVSVSPSIKPPIRQMMLTQNNSTIPIRSQEAPREAPWLVRNLLSARRRAYSPMILHRESIKLYKAFKFLRLHESAYLSHETTRGTRAIIFLGSSPFVLKMCSILKNRVTPRRSSFDTRTRGLPLLALQTLLRRSA